jgi:hypothetical protein
MKKKLLITALLCVSLFSCVVTPYYQVYKTRPVDNTISNKNSLDYEDENCKVSYDFWDAGGNIGFRFYNKTDKNIYLMLEDCFFILNGISNNYYRNRVFTTSTNHGMSVSQNISFGNYFAGSTFLNKISTAKAIGSISSSGSAVSYNEERIVCVPAKTSKIINEYSINQTLFRDCDLLKYPTSRQVRTKSFSKSDSPFIFSNRITYAVGLGDRPIKFENEFYVSEITNYPEKGIIDRTLETFCGQTGTVKTNQFKNVSPDKFYIRYTKGADNWKH